MTMPQPPELNSPAAVDRMALFYAVHVFELVKQSHSKDPLTLLSLHAEALEKAAAKVLAMHDGILERRLEKT